MKITHNKVGQNLNTADTSKSDKAGRTGSANTAGAGALNTLAGGSDASTKVNLSQRAKDIQKAKDIAMKAPEVDEAKVAKFQKMIDEGTYKVDSEKVADKMLEEQAMFPF